MRTEVRRRVVKAVALGGAATMALAAAAGCSKGVSKQEYEAANQQLGAAKQEIATLQQRLAAQQQPAAVREPKRLESKITIEMGEAPPGYVGTQKMFFGNTGTANTTPFRLPAGKTVGIHLVNIGAKQHEVVIGRKVKLVSGKMDGYVTNLFEKIAADVFVYSSGKQVEVATAADLEEIELDAGTDAWIRLTFPPEAKGEWEIGCLLQEPGQANHYEQGMKAVLIVE